MSNSTRELDRERRAESRNYLAFCAVATVVMAAIVAGAIAML